MIRNYYYNQQLKKFVLGFCNVFSGLQVSTGLGSCGIMPGSLVATAGNVGTGTVAGLGPTINTAPIETWTLIATSTTVFSVIGSVSGVQPMATVGEPYSNGIIAFMIVEGGSPFVIGDSFSFAMHGGPSFVPVPISYGSKDRVVASIGARNTQNALHSLPIMSAYMTNLELAPDRLKGVNVSDYRTFLKQGGIFPQDVEVIHRVMPIPYDMMMELMVYASNTDQLFQILEQIMLLFDYDLQLQFNDAPFDWTNITSLFLEGTQNEENYPSGTEKRMLMYSFSFRMPIWLSPPAEIRNQIIQQIKLSFGELDDLLINEYDENGNIVPFTSPWFEINIVEGVTYGTNNSEYTGVGNGVLQGLVTVAQNPPMERWTVTAGSPTAFTVTGTISGPQNNATVGVPYSNGIISFTITQGSLAYGVGDSFNFSVTATATGPSANTTDYLNGGTAPTGPSYPTIPIATDPPDTTKANPQFENGDGDSLPA
jgi:hypothetical protein